MVKVKGHKRHIKAQTITVKPHNRDIAEKDKPKFSKRNLDDSKVKRKVIQGESFRDMKKTNSTWKLSKIHRNKEYKVYQKGDKKLIITRIGKTNNVGVSVVKNNKEINSKKYSLFKTYKEHYDLAMADSKLYMSLN